MEFFFGAFTSEWEQKRAALLHEMSLGGKAEQSEENLFKYVHQIKEVKRGGGGPKVKPMRMPRMQFPRISMPSGIAADSSRPMEARLTSVAKGSQPAVVKMASYGGGARVGSMLNYVSRGGELKVENENGEKLEDREDLARIRGDWNHLFHNRTESRDIGSFSVEVAASADGEDLHGRVRDILSSGFGDRRYAYAVAESGDGSLTIDGLVVLRSGQGERLTADAKAAGIVQQRFDASAVAGQGAARFSFGGYGNGVEYGTTKVRELIEDSAEVRDDRGRLIADGKAAGDLVQKEWREELHSRKSRDLMHVIMSARAGTDAGAFEGAVRDFLADQFAGHRYVFAMHDPETDTKEAGEGGKRPHVHAHAIVTMRSEAGDRIETTPTTFRQWREVMAEKARDHGINMEMTDRREFASAPAYTRNQVRAVNRDGRTEHVGTSEPAQARYDAKRSGRRTLASSDRSRQYTVKAQETWQKIAAVSGDRRTVAFAAEHRDVIETGLKELDSANSSTVVHSDFGGDFRTNMITLQKMLLEAEDMREQTRQEFESYEKTVETALFRLERSAGPDDRAGFDEVATTAREIVDLRREMLELTERVGDRQIGNEADREPLADAMEQRVGADERSGAVAADAVRDDAVRLANEADEVSKKWDEAVAKHGEAVVEAGNDAMIDVEHFREGIALVQSGEFSEEDLEMYETGLRSALRRAAELAADGNAYLRDVAVEDPELRSEVEKIDREDGRTDESTTNKTASTSDVPDDRQRDLQLDAEEERGQLPNERETHELADTIEATNRQQDRVKQEREAGQKAGETTRTDPAQQHVPRLEELEREQNEQRDRDRDDRER
ncbi:conjugal transfer protein TraA [Agrobacterium vitis]|uniref:relaxase/mobilization nuclease domain-containing protein n=1 Tax=Agrobacterium vitis TaxID=373 RepID=UPI002E31B31D|nr:conjugal transfer protein TraA [Agrobacterium vitis]MCE6077542.1 conjugal transfer protein TraA [Agrobacterium vitis]